MNTARHSAGYRIDKVYVADQEYKIIPAGEVSSDIAVADRPVNFGWDWRPISARRFEVIIKVSIDPVKLAPEKLSVRLIGLFSAEEGEQSIALPQFLKYNGPAILFPFAREVISTMSGRGPHGAFHLNPLNVISLVKEFEYTKTTGYEFLEASPDFARDFQLDFRVADTQDVSTRS